MKITYDPKAKAVYVQVTANKVIAHARYPEGVRVDMDKAYQVVGIEVLNVEFKPEIEEI